MAYYNHDNTDFTEQGPKTSLKSGVFSPKGVDVFTALGKVKFMDIPETDLYGFFTDGRIVGLLMDQMLNSRYKNLSAMRSGNNKGFDLYQTSGNGATAAKPLLWETKVWTKHGCDLAPSGMKGAGRTYKEDEFHANAKSLTGGFIVVDVRNFPAMKVFAIPTAAHAALGHPRKVTPTIYEKIVKGTVTAPDTPAAAKSAKPTFTGSAKTGWTLTMIGAPTLRIEKGEGIHYIYEQGKKKAIGQAGSLKEAKEQAIQIAQARAVLPITAPASKTPKKAAAKTPAKKAAKKAIPARKAAAPKKAPKRSLKATARHDRS